MDCFPIENHKNYCVKSIEVNFINEFLPGGNLLLNKSETFKAIVEIESLNI